MGANRSDGLDVSGAGFKPAVFKSRSLDMPNGFFYSNAGKLGPGAGLVIAAYALVVVVKLAVDYGVI